MRRAVQGVWLAIAIAIGPAARTAGAEPSTAPAPAPVPDHVQEARRHFQRGLEFYGQSDFRSALVEFQEAYKIAPNYRLLFNIGQTYEALQDFAGAVDAFRKYLEQGATDVAPERRQQVLAEQKQLEGHVATIYVGVNVADAELVAEGDRRIDLGRSPLPASVLLNGGRWTITAQKPGYATASAVVLVAGGDEKTVELALAPLPALRVVPPFPVVEARRALVEPAPPPDASRTPMWIGVAATAAFAVAAGVTGTLALVAKSDYDTQIATFGTTLQDISSARDRTHTFAVATDVLGSVALLSAVATIVITLVTGPTRHGRTSVGAEGLRLLF